MKIFAIANTTIQLGGCVEAEGTDTKQKLPLTRREFLSGTGILSGSIAVGSTLAALAPSPAWALELKTLSTAEGTTLIKMGRVLYPHAKLPDAVYALLAKDLDAGAAGDAKTASMLKDGIASLNKAANGNFDSATDAAKLAAVKSIEGTPFFNAARGKCITSLYDNDMAYAAFGYPGASFDKGGYITRGFQDLKWLPEPSKEASPAACWARFDKFGANQTQQIRRQSSWQSLDTMRQWWSLLVRAQVAVRWRMSCVKKA